MRVLSVHVRERERKGERERESEREREALHWLLLGGGGERVSNRMREAQNECKMEAGTAVSFKSSTSLRTRFEVGYTPCQKRWGTPHQKNPSNEGLECTTWLEVGV